MQPVQQRIPFGPEERARRAVRLIVGQQFPSRHQPDLDTAPVVRSESHTGGNPFQWHVAGPNGQLVPLGAVATLRHGVEARSLNRFQQLNAVKLSGVAIRPLDQALRFLEDEAAKLLPQGYVIDYTGESRQLRLEGGSRFFATTGLAIVLIFLVLAAQFNSFRDPLIILLGSVPLALFGALLFTFLKMPNPNIPFPLTEGWTTTLFVVPALYLLLARDHTHDRDAEQAAAVVHV